MRKKFLSLALALALCLGLFVVPASAAGATVTEILSADTYDQFLTDASGNYWSGGMSSFTGGLASCGSRYTGYGLVDITGKVILPPGTSEAAITFHDGVAWVFKTGFWIAVDTSGRELFRLKPGDIGAYSVEVFSDGLARVSTKDGMSGYLDKTGKLAIPMEYRAAGDFHDGLAKVYDRVNAFWGYIDKTGKVVIPYQYDNAEDFTNGFAKVTLGYKEVFIDTTGKPVVQPEGYTTRYVTAQGVLISSKAASDGGTLYVFGNKSGEIISGPYEIFKPYECVEGLYHVEKEDKYGYVNEAGVEVIPCQYRSTWDFKDGFTKVRTFGSTDFTFIDKTGRVTGTYAGECARIGNGCFLIADKTSSSKTRYGIIDYTGREIVPCKYKKIGEFSCGVAPVWDFSDKCGFVNTEGQEVVPCKLGGITSSGEGTYMVTGYHDDGRASVIRGTGWTPPTTTAPSAPAQPAGPSATPTASKVLVNGKEVAFDAYTIDGSNYFKLRDLAFVLNGTEKQFEVGWDNASKTITLTSGQSYTANGSEMAKGSGAQSAAVSASKLLIDGKEMSLTAYTIGGSNYFKLRDIGQAFDFGIGWDSASKTITIDTSAGYTA